jgi:two-component system, cell cycle response regulator
MTDESTVVITDIKAALASSETEAAAKPPCLLAVGGELNGTIFDLIPGETTMGRDADNSYCLEFQGISRKHMQIKLNNDESEAILSDLGSKNGTFVNNNKIEGTHTLNKGDMIKVGSIAFKFLPKGDPERLTYDKLNLEASTDGLTKCFNKSYFNDALDTEVKKSKVTGAPLSLIIFDLDYFKPINDNFGHDAGDHVLIEMAELLRNDGVRTGDIFARYGGEEFVVLLPKTTIIQALDIAKRLRRAIEEKKFMYDGNRMKVTASIGVADYRKNVNNGTDLFKRADSMVFAAKDDQRNCVYFFDDRLNEGKGGPRRGDKGEPREKVDR